MSYKLLAIREITGTITLITGLHIGAGNDEIKIGGIDNPVIKHPITGLPYIPGSSLKGKVRSLLEWHLGRVDPEGKPWEKFDENDEQGRAICRIFGISGANAEDYKEGPSRALFRDCYLTEESRKQLIEANALTEDKVEVTIDRIKGTSGGGGPRHMERVPAGAQFEFCLHYKIMDIDGDNGKTDERNFDYLLKGLKLLELDALGGCGSRGYGKIKFQFKDKDIQKKFDELKLFENENERP